MKAATIIGIVISILACLGASMMEGVAPPALINIPAMIIVLGGTFGATFAAMGMERMKAVPAMYKKAFSAEPIELRTHVEEIVHFSERARRDGLLALESDVETIENEFLKKGLQLVVDGTDPDMIREILESEIDGMAARHKSHGEVFKTAGGFGPTLGIIGTVLSLVHVLQNLSQPETLGPSISGAFIATLLGVGSANLIFLPVASRLKGLSEEEVEQRALLLEGVLAIQAGANPRVVSEKLMAFVPPSQRTAEAASETSAAAPEPVAA